MGFNSGFKGLNTVGRFDEPKCRGQHHSARENNKLDSWQYTANGLK